MQSPTWLLSSLLLLLALTTPYSCLAWTSTSVANRGPPLANNKERHGETVLVLGGSGIVGSGIVMAFVEAGYHVIAPVRSQESKDRLEEELSERKHKVSGSGGSVDILMGHSVESTNAAMNLRDAIENEPVHHVVSSMGSYWSGKMLSQVNEEELDDIWKSRAVPHFNGWKAFYPTVQPPPSRSESNHHEHKPSSPYIFNKPSMYIFIQASIAERCYNANASLIHIACAGQVSISKAARAEAEEDFERGTSSVVVGEIRIGHWVVRPKDYDEGDTHSKNVRIGRCAVQMVQDGLDKMETPFIKLPNRQAVKEYSAGVKASEVL